MFTGLIRWQGMLAGRTASSLLIDCPHLRSRLSFGDSVAVNGVCLTVARLSESGFSADLLPETLRDTTLGQLEPGASLHLETALKAGDELGGHIVQGHVDGVVAVLANGQADPAAGWQLELELPQWLRPWLVPKGGVSVDGVSMTVQLLKENSFLLALIPTTLTETHLGTILPGQRVNIEADLLVKTVRQTVEQILGTMGDTPGQAISAVLAGRKGSVES